MLLAEVNTYLYHHYYQLGTGTGSLEGDAHEG